MNFFIQLAMMPKHFLANNICHESRVVLLKANGFQMRGRRTPEPFDYPVEVQFVKSSIVRMHSAGS
jgi:hypothetical protein